MAERNKTLLYRTNTKESVANASDLGNGEVAININDESPFLMFKNTSGKIEKVGAMKATTGISESVTMTQKAITDEFKLPSTYVKQEYPILDGVEFKATSGGDTLHQSITNIDSNVATLVRELINDEEVLAKAITVLRDTLGLDQNLLIGDAFTNSKNFKGCKTIIDALSVLDGKVK